MVNNPKLCTCVGLGAIAKSSTAGIIDVDPCENGSLADDLSFPCSPKDAGTHSLCPSPATTIVTTKLDQI